MDENAELFFLLNILLLYILTGGREGSFAWPICPAPQLLYFNFATDLLLHKT